MFEICIGEPEIVKHETLTINRDASGDAHIPWRLKANCDSQEYVYDPDQYTRASFGSVQGIPDNQGHILIPTMASLFLLMEAL